MQKNIIPWMLFFFCLPVVLILWIASRDVQFFDPPIKEIVIEKSDSLKTYTVVIEKEEGLAVNNSSIYIYLQSYKWPHLCKEEIFYAEKHAIEGSEIVPVWKSDNTLEITTDSTLFNIKYFQPECFKNKIIIKYKYYRKTLQ